MKNRLVLGIALAISMISCNDEDLSSIVKQPNGVGTISLNTSLKDILDVSTTDRTSTLDRVLDDLFVEIFDNTGVTLVEDQFRNLPEFVELPVGAYTVVFYTPRNSGARFGEGAYGSEPQISFDVVRDSNTTVPVVLQLFDVATTIDFSDLVLQNFPDINANVSISKGDETLSLDWSASEDDSTGYFTMIDYVPGNGGLFEIFSDDLIVEITALDTEGNTVMVSRTYEDAVANQHYKLLISYTENETIDFDITLGDEEIVEDEIPFPDGDDSSETTDEEDTNDEDETSNVIVQGDLIVTEIMNNPDAVSDTNGEWFELYNTTSDKDIPLNGLKIVGASNEFTVDSELTVSPGTYVIFGRNGDVATNGGVAVDYVYGTFTLANTSGSITILSEDNEIDQVVYDDFISEAGKTIQLNQNNLNFVDNDSAANWCVGMTAWNGGDLGTPGTENDCN